MCVQVPRCHSRVPCAWLDQFVVHSIKMRLLRIVYTMKYLKGRTLCPPPLNYFLVPGSCILGRYWGQYRSKIHISWRAGPFQQLHDNSRPCEHAPRWYWCRSLPIRGCSGVVRTSKRHRRRILLLYRCSTGILLYVTETKKGTRRKRKNARFRIQIRIQNTDDLVLVLVHLASSVAERAKVLGTIIR